MFGMARRDGVNGSILGRATRRAGTNALIRGRGGTTPIPAATHLATAGKRAECEKVPDLFHTAFHIHKKAPANRGFAGYERKCGLLSLGNQIVHFYGFLSTWCTVVSLIVEMTRMSSTRISSIMNSAIPDYRQTPDTPEQSEPSSSSRSDASTKSRLGYCIHSQSITHDLKRERSSSRLICVGRMPSSRHSMT